MEQKYVVAKNIRNRRIELGMTQSDLAKKMGYADKSAISRIENGKNDINQSTVERFAKALSTTPMAIMGWTKIRDKVVETYQSGKAVVANNMQDTEIGKAIIKNHVFEEMYNYMDGELPTFQELDYIKTIRRLSAYDKAMVEMILNRDKN